MLQKIRDNTQGLFTKILMGFLILVFAMWGVDTLVGNFISATPQLTVNGDEILTQEIDQLAQSKAQEFLAQLGDNPDLSQFNEAEFRQSAVNELIQRRLLQQSSKGSGMGVSNAAVNRRIAGNQDFYIDGKYNEERALLVLQGAGYTPSSYKAVLGEELLINQLLAAYTATGFATPDQLGQLAALVHQKRNLRYVRVASAPFADAAEVSDQEISDYYQRNQDRFQQEEQVSIEYVELNKQSMMADIMVTEEQLQAAYQEEVATFKAQTERRASHILWEATTDEQLAAARAEAESVKARLDAGEDFAKLAAEFSDDTGSAQNAGDVGYTTGTNFVEPFETALQALAVNEVSAPVQTEFGIHLIKLTEVSETKVDSFEMRREALEKAVKEKQVETLFSDRLEELKNLAFESPDLEEPAAQLMLTRQTTELFGRSGGAGIAAEMPVITAAFSTEVMEDGLNSEVLTIDPNRSIVLRALEHQPAQIRPLDVVRGEVEVSLRAQKAAEQAKKLGESYVSGLRNGDNIDGLLTLQNLGWNNVVDIERVAPNVDPEIVDKAFSMSRPAEGKTEVAGFSLNGGDYVVIELQSVKDGSATDFKDGEEQNMRNFISQQSGSNDVTGFIKSLEARADIEGKETQLEVQDPLL
jgi:peptidyl-prolyl cis-trans isomerase D